MTVLPPTLTTGLRVHAGYPLGRDVDSFIVDGPPRAFTARELYVRTVGPAGVEIGDASARRRGSAADLLAAADQELPELGALLGGEIGLGNLGSGARAGREDGYSRHNRYSHAQMQPCRAAQVKGAA